MEKFVLTDPIVTPRAIVAAKIVELSMKLGLVMTATLAYKLSTQLAAMALNVYNGKVDGSALIKVGSLTPSGFATVDYVMDLANDDLAAHPLTSGGPDKAYQSALSDILDAANKNNSFVQPDPSTCSAPTFSMSTPRVKSVRGIS